ncbi:hypothetical protein Lal_00000471 [Lupinus albus]|nr:hypothetical protein Lal_00000471 [Lupinus albus]
MHTQWLSARTRFKIKLSTIFGAHGFDLYPLRWGRKGTKILYFKLYKESKGRHFLKLSLICDNLPIPTLPILLPSYIIGIDSYYCLEHGEGKDSKRRRGLLKKAYELSVLTDAQAINELASI